MCLCKVSLHTYCDLEQKPFKNSIVRNLKMNLCKVTLHLQVSVIKC
jgi:hypothetical protein